MKISKTLPKILILLFLSWAGYFAFFHWARSAGKLQDRVFPSATNQRDPLDEATDLKTIFPEADHFSIQEVINDLPHYKAYDRNNKLLGIVFNTLDVVPDIQGYGGPIKLLVGVTKDGQIRKIHILSHTETSSYISGLERFLEQFAFLTFKSDFLLGKDIDGITGATVTSEAITQAVKQGVKKVCVELLDLSAPIETPQIPSDASAEAEKKVRAAGLDPYPAQYWKKLNGKN